MTAIFVILVVLLAGAIGYFVYINYTTVARGFRILLTRVREWIKKHWEGEKKQKKVIRQGVERGVVDENNNPVMEEKKPARKDYLKENRLKILVKFFILLVSPIFVLVLFGILGKLGVSILIGLTVATFFSWSGKIKFFGKGLFFGVIVAVVNYFVPWIFGGTIIKAAKILLCLGWLTYLLEEFSGKNIFPKLILHFCTGMVLVNILQTALVATTGHDQLTDVWLSWFHPANSSNTFFNGAQAVVDFFPGIQHVWAEGGRITNTLRQLVEAAQYVFAGLVIAAVSASGEMAQWWGRRKKGEKATGGKLIGESGSFIMYDLLVEAFLAGLWKKTTKEKK